MVSSSSGRSYRRPLWSAWLVAACATTGPQPSAEAKDATHARQQTTLREASRGHLGASALVIGAATAERVAQRWEVAAGGKARAVALSQRAGLVAYSAGQSVRLYRLSDGASQGEVATKGEVLRGGLAFHGAELVIASSSSVVVYDVSKKREARRVDVAESPITAVGFGGDWVAAGHHDGVIRVYPLQAAHVREIPVPGPPVDVKSIALTPSGEYVVAAWVQGSIWWWSLQRPAEPHKLVRYEHESDATAFSRDGALLAEEGELRQTTVWKFSEPVKRVAQLRQGAWLKKLLFTPDQKWLVRAGSEGIELAEIEGNRRVELDSRAPVEDAAFDETATHLASGDRAGRLLLFGVKP